MLKRFVVFKDIIVAKIDEKNYGNYFFGVFNKKNNKIKNIENDEIYPLSIIKSWNFLDSKLCIKSLKEYYESYDMDSLKFKFITLPSFRRRIKQYDKFVIHQQKIKEKQSGKKQSIEHVEQF
jgi:hypothetical protein